MQKVVLALFLAVVAVNGAILERERRQLPIVGSLLNPPSSGSSGGSGATGTGAGGLVGAGVGANGANKQACEAIQGQCASSACTANNNQVNQASGSGLLAGVGQVAGNVGAPVNVCPSLCATCTQLGLLTVG